MRLRVLIPTGVMVDRKVTKIGAQAPDGSFALLPKHIDYVAPLVAGLLFYEDDRGEQVIAIDEGVMVKAGEETLVSCRNAIEGGQLEQLMETVEHQFQNLDEQERHARSAMAKMEADFVRNLLKNERYG